MKRAEGRSKRSLIAQSIDDASSDHHALAEYMHHSLLMMPIEEPLLSLSLFLLSSRSRFDGISSPLLDSSQRRWLKALVCSNLSRMTAPQNIALRT